MLVTKVRVAVDSSIVRAHQHAAGVRRTSTSHPGGGRIVRRAHRPADHAIGRSRGGPSSKIHRACDGHGRPLSIVLTGGNVNDRTRFDQVMVGIRFFRPGPGGPASRPARVIADKGYSTRAVRVRLRRREIPTTIPERRNQQANRLRRGRAGGRPPAFDRTAYKRRAVVERCVNRLMQFRAISTRHGKTARSYRAVIDLVTLVLRL